MRVFDAGLAYLLEQDAIRAASDGFALHAHEVSVGDTERALRDDLLRRFTAQGVAAASPSEILATVPGDPKVVRELFHHLVRNGHLVRICGLCRGVREHRHGRRALL